MLPRNEVPCEPWATINFLIRSRIYPYLVGEVVLSERHEANPLQDICSSAFLPGKDIFLVDVTEPGSAATGTASFAAESSLTHAVLSKCRCHAPDYGTARKAKESFSQAPRPTLFTSIGEATASKPVLCKSIIGVKPTFEMLLQPISKIWIRVHAPPARGGQAMPEAGKPLGNIIQEYWSIGLLGFSPLLHYSMTPCFPIRRLSSRFLR